MSDDLAARVAALETEVQALTYGGNAAFRRLDRVEAALRQWAADCIERGEDALLLTGPASPAVRLLAAMDAAAAPAPSPPPSCQTPWPTWTACRW